jgi:CO/xanthine dehydrogenase FAD-binding subunit
MSMTNPKHYYRPKTLADALEQASKPGSIALAGGALTFGGLELPYETVVDLQDLTDLRQISQDEDGLHLGGTATLQSVVESDLVPEVVRRSLTRAIPLNLRNGASVGESLMLKTPPAEWLSVLMALDAGIEQFLWNGERVTDGIASMVSGASKQQFGQGIITRVFLPRLREREALGAAFVARTPADQPIVNAAAFVRLDTSGKVETAFVALGGVSAQPVVNFHIASLQGGPLNAASITDAAQWVQSQVRPVGDYRGSAEYRAEMARLTVQRALMECVI